MDVYTQSIPGRIPAVCRYGGAAAAPGDLISYLFVSSV